MICIIYKCSSKLTVSVSKECGVFSLDEFLLAARCLSGSKLSSAEEKSHPEPGPEGRDAIFKISWQFRTQKSLMSVVAFVTVLRRARDMIWGGSVAGMSNPCSQ